MEDLGTSAIQLELKYCERCGGLWLRPKGSDLVFCGGCASAMAGVSAFCRRPHAQQKRQKSFWGEGGNA